MSLEEILKKHEYTGYMNLIKKTNNIEDLKYYRSDVYSGIRNFSKLKENYENYIRKRIKNNWQFSSFIKKGITPKDIELTQKWYKEEMLPLINSRIKELRLE